MSWESHEPLKDCRIDTTATMPLGRPFAIMRLICPVALAALALVFNSPCRVTAQVSLLNVAHLNSNTNAQALGVAVAGNYAYLANQYDGLRIYDVSDPTNPFEVAHVNDGGLASCVVLSGNYAYLANGGDGLRIYNVSDPTHPVSVGHATEGSPILETWDVAVSSNRA